MVPVLFPTTYTFTKGSKIGKSKSGEKLDTVTLTREAGVGGTEFKVILGYISSSNANRAT